jgi:hypothetical protein
MRGFYPERVRASEQRCQIKQNFRVAIKALKFIKVRWGQGVGSGGVGADTCKAWVAQLVFYNNLANKVARNLTKKGMLGEFMFV